MKRADAGVFRTLFALGFLAVLPFFVVAIGTKEQKPALADPVTDWIIGVAAFESPSEGDTKNADSLGDLVYSALLSAKIHRFTESEGEAYKNKLKAAKIAAALKVLETARGTRDALLFKGFPDWQYDKEAAKADLALVQAETGLKEAYDFVPEYTPDRPIKASEDNKAGLFIPTPKPGTERTLCETKKLDALLLGKVEDFFGRTFVSVRLYSALLDADIWSWETLFGPEDRETVLEELKSRARAAASGLGGAAFSIRTNVPGADIFIDGILVGQGSVGPLDHAPGPLRLGLRAEGHANLETSIELNADEHARVELRLATVPMTGIFISAHDVEGSPTVPDARLRLDSLFVGTTPMRVDVPSGKWYHIEAEVPDMATISEPEVPEAPLASEPFDAAIPGGEVDDTATADTAATEPAATDNALTEKAAAINVPPGKASGTEQPVPPTEPRSAVSSVFFADGTGVLRLQPEDLPDRDKRPVEDARRAFYNAFGRFSLVLPFAFFVSGTSTVYKDTAHDRSSDILGQRAVESGYVSIALNVLAGAFFAESAYRLYSYLRQSAVRAPKRIPVTFQ